MFIRTNLGWIVPVAVMLPWLAMDGWTSAAVVGLLAGAHIASRGGVASGRI